MLLRYLMRHIYKNLIVKLADYRKVITLVSVKRAWQTFKAKS
jgi:hypothetical protein